jgi:hypothetical protein
LLATEACAIEFLRWFLTFKPSFLENFITQDKLWTFFYIQELLSQTERQEMLSVLSFFFSCAAEPMFSFVRLLAPMPPTFSPLSACFVGQEAIFYSQAN